jgi:hypothetical protein
MLDREAWRSSIKMMVAENEEVDSTTKRENRKIKTRSAIIAVNF